MSVTRTAEQHISEIRRKCSGGANFAHRMSRSLNILYQSNDTHFVFEIIQNAEDNSYAKSVFPELIFKLHLNKSPPELEIINNEVGFQPENVDSICSIGDSTKKNNKKDGYIGEKGLGFKSVFQVCMLKLLSNKYQFSLSAIPDEELNIPLISPKWLNGTQAPEFGTKLVLFLRQNKVNIVKKGLMRLSAETILFLKKINKLQVIVEGSNSKLTVSRDVSQYPLVTLKSDKTIIENMYYIHKKTFQKPEHVEDFRREDIFEREVTIALPLRHVSTRLTGHKRSTMDGEGDGEYDETVPEIPVFNVFSYLPTDAKSRLPFLMNSDFILNSSREELADPETNNWNSWLLYGCVGECFKEVFMSLLSNESLSYSDRIRAYQFIPLLQSSNNNSDKNHHQQHGAVYYTRIAENIRNELSKMEVVILPYPKSTL